MCLSQIVGVPAAPGRAGTRSFPSSYSELLGVHHHSHTGTMAQHGRMRHLTEDEAAAEVWDGQAWKPPEDSNPSAADEKPLTAAQEKIKRIIDAENSFLTLVQHSARHLAEHPASLRQLGPFRAIAADCTPAAASVAATHRCRRCCLCPPPLPQNLPLPALDALDRPTWNIEDREILSKFRRCAAHIPRHCPLSHPLPSCCAAALASFCCLVPPPPCLSSAQLSHPLEWAGRASVCCHPDKNPSEEAATAFEKLGLRSPLPPRGNPSAGGLPSLRLRDKAEWKRERQSGRREAVREGRGKGRIISAVD